MREALHALVMEGTVSLDPYRGFSVAELAVSEAVDLYETRAVLEALAARRAVPLLTETDLDRLREALAAMEHAHEAADPTEYYRWDRAFHKTLYTASDRPVLMRQIAGLSASSVRYQRYQTARLLEPGGMAASLRAHRGILDACARSDARTSPKISSAVTLKKPLRVSFVHSQLRRPPAP